MLANPMNVRRLRRMAFVCFLAALAGSPLLAQSNPVPGQPMTASSGMPEPPVGTHFTASSGGHPVRPDTRVTRGLDKQYRIGAGDVLEIEVWHEKDVSAKVPVRPDGKISLPLIGSVRAAGLTPKQLKYELESEFAKYLTNPTVSVIVAEIRSQRINVLGQVLRPGTYPLIPPMDVIDAIAVAGGLGEFADKGGIYVLRTLPNGHRERIKYDYEDVLEGKKDSHDILLKTRDTVVVP